MIRVTTSSVINAPVETVWTVARDFNGLPGWMPAIKTSKIEDGLPADQVGCVRHMEFTDGGMIRERLVALSDVDYAMTYVILISPMPLDKYLATLRLQPITDGGRTFVTWTAEFDVAAEHEAEMRQTIGQGVFQAAFDSLKQRFGG